MSCVVMQITTSTCTLCSHRVLFFIWILGCALDVCLSASQCSLLLIADELHAFACTHRCTVCSVSRLLGGLKLDMLLNMCPSGQRQPGALPACGSWVHVVQSMLLSTAQRLWTSVFSINQHMFVHCML